MFADIAGFTAWSSVREPSQVFTLLEALYRSFDETAKRRRVFKVETVGDCYVAVTGLPEPRRDHAVAMARFARECVTAMQVLVKRLEVLLGPDTGDLELRVGLHSGVSSSSLTSAGVNWLSHIELCLSHHQPVTGGVLRGERSRFQLFGDTMTVCSRMESTGIRGKIQISEDTADLLQSAGKDRWIKRRDEKVVAKGKGEMQTYWLAVTKEEEGSDLDNSGHSTNSWHDAADSAVHPDKKQFNADVQSKTNRLVEWNVEVLMRLLKQIEARRRVLTKINPPRVADANEYELSSDDHMVIDEVREIITLPQDNYSDAILRAEEDVTLAPVVGEELTDFVSNIASLYNDSNPFHNFEHASHVTMSVVKLLSRIVAPSDNDFGENGSSLHDHTYGITSDPLTQFSCVLSALIHDGKCEKRLHR
jgi:class 3 adenylate cyclase